MSLALPLLPVEQRSDIRYVESPDLNYRRLFSGNVQPVVNKMPNAEILSSIARRQHLTLKLESRSSEFAKSNRENEILRAVCQTLIDAGADVTERTHIYLDDFSEEEAVAWLSSHRADADRARMLELAIEFNSERWLCAQLRTGDSPNLRDRCGVPLVCYATKNPKILTRMLDAGADAKATVDLQCDIVGSSFWWDQSTTLHFAAFYGNTEAIRLLLKNGLDVNSLDVFHRTPLFSAAHSVSPDAITELIHAGADLRVTDFEGRSALEFLQNSGYDRTDLDFQRALAALSVR
jgi:hypothetical protein